MLFKEFSVFFILIWIGFVAGIGLLDNDPFFEKMLQAKEYQGPNLKLNLTSESKKFRFKREIFDIPQILAKIKEGDQHVRVCGEENIVIVLGNPRSGKTTFTRFMASNNSKLTSVKNEYGQFRITEVEDLDLNKRINLNSSFPELVINSKNGQAFFDYPSFHRNNEEFDFVSTFLIKKVTNLAKRVKLAFTINHKHIMGDLNDTTEFKSLVQNIIGFVGNLEKFSNSMALIVTNIDSNSHNDIEILENISRFLNTVLNEYKSLTSKENSTASEKLFFGKCIKLVDILLKNETIGLFYSPNRGGILSEIKSVQLNKEKLDQILYEKINFTTKENEDFQYNIPLELESKIGDLKSEIYSQINYEFSKFPQIIRQHYYTLIKNSDYSKSLELKLNNELAEFYSFLGNTYEKNPQDIFRELIYFTNELNITIPRSLLIQMADNQKYLEFFQSLENSQFFKKEIPFRFNTSIFISAYLQEPFDAYYYFLKSLHSKFLTQLPRKPLNQTQLETWGNDKKTIGSQDFDDVLKAIEPLNIEYYHKVKDMVTESTKVNFLQHEIRGIIQNTLFLEPVSFNCSEPDKMIIIKGYSVTMSEVIKFSKRCPFKVKYLMVYASNTILFDSNFVKNDELSAMILIAPGWKVGPLSVVINLNGQNGNAYSYEGKNDGKDGRPGLPGQNAASFIGIGLEFEGMERFSIAAVGGVGGRGESGGVGKPGEDGEDYDRPLIDKMENCKKNLALVNKYCNFGRAGTPADADFFYDCYFKGTKPTIGKDGGSGGYKGIGGNGGVIQLMSMSNNDGFSSVSKTSGGGMEGEGGDGGAGGLGGQYGYEKYEKCRVYHTRAIYIDSWDVYGDRLGRPLPTSLRTFRPEGRAANGRPGREDFNKDGQIQPDPPISNEEIREFIQTGIDEFRTFLQAGFKNKFRANYFRNFLSILNRNEFVRSLCAPYPLAVRLQNLRNKQKSLDTEEILQFYVQFLEDIKQCLSQSKSEINSDGTGVLNHYAIWYIGAATQSIIGDLLYNSESTLIIDIKTFLDLTSESLVELYNEKSKESKQKLRNKYNETIFKKIGEATDFVENEINPEINYLNNITQISLEKLTTEIEELTKNVENNREKLIEQAIEYEKTKVLRGILGSVKVISNFGVLLGPKGAAAGAIADVTKWRVQETLKDMKLKLSEWTSGFKVQVEIVQLVEKLSDALTTLINVYDRIQDFQQQGQLAEYIAKISEDYSEDFYTHIENPKLRNIVSETKMSLQTTLVMNQYKRSINALKQWVFPFSHRFLLEFEKPTGNNETELIYKVKEEISKLKNKLVEYKSTIFKHDEYMHSSDFSSKYVSTDPFYKWSYRNHPKQFEKLVSGGTVYLKADILNQIDPTKYAVKFNKIKLEFVSSNQVIQEQIRSFLKKFKITMTHMGNSYYRVGDKFFVITSEKQSIVYNFEVDEKGFQISPNDVYKKLLEGDLMLSPYALWGFKIENASGKMGNITKLRKYLGHFDLELCGRGHYVSDRVNVENLQLENYYQSDDTLSQLKNLDVLNNEPYEENEEVCTRHLNE